MNEDEKKIREETISIYDKYKKDWAKIADEISKIIDINDNKSINIVYETLSEKANIILKKIHSSLLIEEIDSAEKDLAIDNHIKRLRKKFRNRQQGSSTRYGRGLFYEQPKHTISTVIQKIKNIFKG